MPVPTDIATNDGGGPTETVVCEFHIVFHTVYQTPVLYFRAARLDGSPFPVACHVSTLQLPGSRLGASTVASMEEHSVLGTPFWFLHPCETAAAMELLMQQQQQAPNLIERTPSSKDSEAGPAYLLSWLSLVVPLTGIQPLDYADFTAENEKGRVAHGVQIKEEVTQMHSLEL